jgi:predicted HD superfamily hydrolase involved in NAD metabolism
MNREHMLSLVRQHLTEQRYQHTLGVLESAIELARQYGADVEKAEQAAIFHDYAKFRNEKEMMQIIKDTPNMPQDLLHYHKELWHAPVGALLVRKEAGIKDDEVLKAIFYHTTGRPHMTLLEKIIYLADYIEPGRVFPGVDQVRALAKSNLNQALLSAMERTILFIEKKGESVYPLTRQAFEALALEIRSK